MMRRFFCSVLFFVLLVSAVQAQHWIRSYADTSNLNVRVRGLISDSLGNVYLLSLIPYSVVYKISPDGDMLWKRTLQVSYATGINLSRLAWSDAGNVLCMIHGTDGPYLVELDPATGAEIGSPVFHSFDKFQGWAKFNSGVMLVSCTNGTDAYFRKLNANGGVILEKYIETPLFILGSSAHGVGDFTPTPDGGGVLRCAYQDTTVSGVFGRNVLLWIDSDANLLRYTPLNEMLISTDWKTALLQNKGLAFARRLGHSVEVHRYDSLGNLLWLKKVPDDTPNIWGVTGTPDNGLLVTGSAVLPLPGLSALLPRLVLFKFDADGNLEWRRHVHPEPAASSQGMAVTITPDGDWVAAGYQYDSFGMNSRRLMMARGGFATATVSGQVLRDEDNDCLPDSGELALQRFVVRAGKAGSANYAIADSAGHYEMAVDTGLYVVEALPVSPYWLPCDAETVDLLQNGSRDTVDFSVGADILCPAPEVSLGSFGLKLCNTNTLVVRYCNLGTADADPAELQVVLPPELDFYQAEIPPSAQAGDTLWFNLGNLGINECGTLRIWVMVDCDSAVMGQTLCTEARIFPDSLCWDPPGWNGADIEVSAKCIGDTTVQFRILNKGKAANSVDQNYFVIEDQVVLMNGQFNLQANASQFINRQATGAYLRLEAQQEPNHPVPFPVVAWAEGCGGFNGPGYINQYSLGDDEPNIDIDCQEVVSSFDPNDKQGFPAGLGTEHSIERNTELTYLVRFQNTGTDTARLVLVRDTLSAWLDPATLRIGAASHPFVWHLEGAGVLSFVFEDIVLPDSNHNEPASHGFLQYRIRPKSTTPLGTRIENRAAIYFDFNPPVMTNTAFHTVDSAYLTVQVDEAPASRQPVRVMPNPLAGHAVFQLPDAPAGTLYFYLADGAGRLVRSTPFTGNRLVFDRGSLPAGMYFFRIETSNGILLGSGKVVAGDTTE